MLQKHSLRIGFTMKQPSKKLSFRPPNMITNMMPLYDPYNFEEIDDMDRYEAEEREYRAEQAKWEACGEHQWKFSHMPFDGCLIHTCVKCEMPMISNRLEGFVE